MKSDPIKKYIRHQKHAGDSSQPSGGKLWHTSSKGKYWSGKWHDRTPQELLDECLSTVADLLRNHPNLKIK